MSTLKILTCNIRFYGAKDGDNAWEHRKDFCAEVIRGEEPDLIGFQEMWAEQYDDLTRALPGYDTFAMVDEPTGKRPMNCIFYRRERFVRVSAGGYWLSETPHVAGTKSWDSVCVRLANWVRLNDSVTGREFRFVNTHLDHVGQTARERQAALIAADAAAYPEEYPQILTGDMNCDTRNPAIDNLKAGGWVDTYGQIYETEDPGHTFHAFRGPDHSGKVGKMDWIFVRGQVQVTDAGVITTSRDNRYPSDHYFVSAAINL